MNYVRKLGFEETPDYDFLRELFSKVLKTVGEPDDGIFDWMLLNGGKGWEASQRSKVSNPCKFSDHLYSFPSSRTQRRRHIRLIANTDIVIRTNAVHVSLYKIAVLRQRRSSLVPPLLTSKDQADDQ
jgi:casein kinase 1